MTQSTRQQLLETAKILFAERGFYGVSIANIAAEHGLTKQALLHHFSTKEKLYGEILQQISEEFDAIRMSAQSANDDAIERLKAILLAMVPKTQRDYVHMRLLMRELLDNHERAPTAGAWYLRPLLQGLIKMTKTAPAWANASDAQALALVYQLLGAVNYYGVSETTLQGIFGKTMVNRLKRAYPAQLEETIETMLSTSPNES